MSSAFVNFVATYLPETNLSNDDVLRENDKWDNEKVISKLGFKNRRVTNNNEFSSDLAIGAVNNLLQLTSLDDIDFILYCTQSPDYLIPSNAFLLHNHFQFNKNVGALDFNLGCSGYVYGLSLAKGLINSRQATKILLITSETYSKVINENDISNRLIFGDGASATIVSDTPCGANLRIDNCKFGTDGTGWDKLTSCIGGIKSLKTSEDFLKMNGQEVLLFTLREIPPLLQTLLEANDLNQEDIHHFVFHQANKFVLDQITKKAKLDPSLVRINMENYSNTVSTTIPIVLEDLIKKDLINPNERLALVGFGVGFSWAGTILTKITS